MSIFDFFRGRGQPLTLERLDAVFQKLEANWVMARLYPESGRSEAHLFIRQELAEAAHRGITFDGFCFCDLHSFEGLEEGVLTFNFGSAHPFPTYRALWTAQVIAGRQVGSALAASALTVEWNEDPASVLAIVGVKWAGPHEQPGVTGARLPLGRNPRPLALPAQTSVFVGGPVPGDLGHKLLARIAALKGSPMFGPADGSGSAAVDYQASGRLIDLVTGANSAAVPLGVHLLGNRDLVGECRLLLDVVDRADAPPCSWWNAGFTPEQRVRLVCSGDTEPAFDGSQAITLGSDAASLARALTTLEARAAALG